MLPELLLSTIQVLLRVTLSAVLGLNPRVPHGTGRLPHDPAKHVSSYILRTGMVLILSCTSALSCRRPRSRLCRPFQPHPPFFRCRVADGAFMLGNSIEFSCRLGSSTHPPKRVFAGLVRQYQRRVALTCHRFTA
jgi:hypothetical protein